ncbi:MAG: helix-turn-helix transcriptional regulator [Sphingomonadales bacterium]|jgi:hypothetical protein
MTPGAYLALRRGAAGLMPAQVDQALGWEPETMAWIEGNLRRVTPELMDALHGVFPFDPIIARRLGEGSPARVCRGCGCSESDACWDEKRGGCHWVAPTLCSDCRDTGVIG